MIVGVVISRWEGDIKFPLEWEGAVAARQIPYINA